MHPTLFAQRLHRRLVLDPDELAAYVAEYDSPLGVVTTTPLIYVIIDLVESESSDFTSRFPYLRIVFRGQLAGGSNVVILPVIADPSIGNVGDIVFVREERHATGSLELGLPRGFAEPGLSVAANALKELKEETGYVGDEVRELGMTTTDSGIMDACVHYVLVPLVGRAAPSHESSEAIAEIEVISPEEAWSQIRDGRIRDGFTLQAIALWEKFGTTMRK